MKFRFQILCSHCSLRHSSGSTVVAAEQVFNVRDAGATGDGKTLDTEAIQKSFDACGKAGGGTVLVPAGTYLSKPLVIRTKTTLRLDKGATLKATDDPADYARARQARRSSTTSSPAKTSKTSRSRATASIDGSGQRWWIPAEEARQKKSGYTLPRPNLIVLTRVKNLVVRDVTIQNSPKFHFVPTECDGVLVENATFLAPERAPNTDAIDPSMCRNVTITGCTIDVGDDNVAVKSGKTAAGREFACEGLTITDCTFKHGHGISIGSETVGGVKDVVVRNCTFEDTDNGIRIKSDRTARRHGRKRALRKHHDEERPRRDHDHQLLPEDPRDRHTPAGHQDDARLQEHHDPQSHGHQHQRRRRDRRPARKPDRKRAARKRADHRRRHRPRDSPRPRHRAGQRDDHAARRARR